jgi:DNA polymerase I-like protein with 3'-5' exonuclease and polymerase domains
MGLNLKPKMWTPKPDKDGNKKPSTAIDHIMMFEDVPEAQVFVGLIKRYSQAAKARGTYVGEEDGSGDNGFLSCLAGDDRFHPNFFLFTGDKDHDEGGTVTGRTSAKNPAVQTIPVHHPWAKRLKECYIAPPGHVIAGCDYMQGELMVAACIANEENMIASYKAGRDLHVETSAEFAGYTYDGLLALKKTDEHLYKETRQLGKAGNLSRF